MRFLKLSAFLYLFSGVIILGQGGAGYEGSSRTQQDTMVVTQPPRIIRGTPVVGPQQQDEITMDTESSLRFVQRLYSAHGLWKRSHDPLHDALGLLIYYASHPTSDSLLGYLKGYDFESLRIPLENCYLLDTLRIIVPYMPSDSLLSDTIPDPGKAGEMFIEAGKRLEKVRLNADARPVGSNDTLRLNDSVYIVMDDFVPAVLPRRTNDTIVLIITDTVPEPTIARDDFPFRFLKYPATADSLRAAVRSLTGFLLERDSTFLNVVSETGRGTGVWLNGKSDNLMRFWLPGSGGDSVTVWIGSQGRDTLSLKAEEGVLFKKQFWHDRYIDTHVNVTSSEEEALRKVALTKIKPDLWKYKGDMSYLLSQGVISNWAKGGENNVSSVIDVTGYLDYNNKVTKVTSSNSVRFALGLQASGRNADIKKNLDIIEINSKVNHKAFGKFDLSGLFQFKTQFLPGYNYPNDSVKVSKFFNPATLILGYGLDYKPDKNTSISFSPISYKGTYVLDTALINQTKFGIAADRRAKNEMGAYLTINSKTILFEKVTMSNKIQFFSNFLSKPQNVDIDWEMIATASLNWFTDIRLNMHLIYDDNTLLPLYDKDGEPVLDTEGVQRKSPRLQFKELLGLSFVFKF